MYFSIEWLSKAVYYSTEEVVDANFKDYMFYVDFLLARTRKFRVAGVEPVMVFNGKSNPLSVVIVSLTRM